ncbi:uncharacterized protein LOC106869402 [Octopus bimaculoides]|nr:uncharacterized protein LOC106869402 [Octopus bimaculoides]
MGKKLLKNKKVTTETCIEKCLSHKNCLSFEMTKSGKCYLSKETAATSEKLKSAKDRDYYQRIKPDDKQITLKEVSIPGKDILGLHKKMDLKKCNESCQRYPECNSYQYNEKDKMCKLTKATHLTHELKISKGIWDTYFLNLDYLEINCGPPNDVTGSVKSYNSTTYKSEVNYTCPEGEKLNSVCEKDNKWTPVASVCKAYAHINCGNPKDVASALKSYTTTTYKSEVTYTCPKGEKLKSTCEKDNKWTPVASACKDIKIHFMKIKNAVLDVVGKIILSGKNITEDDCAEKCLSDEKCLSFEISKKGGKCYLSKQTAASSKKMKLDKDRDYYQRVKSTGEPVTVKKVNLQKADTLGRVKNKTLKECNKTCQEYPGCNSFQYNEEAKLCDLSNVTQLTDKLQPNDGSWDIFVLNPTFTQVNCGSPKSVINAKKFYKTITYKSEVTYICPGGEKFKATCKDNNKWDPIIPSCKASQIHFVKIQDAILDVPGKTLADKKNVTANDCAKQCLSDKTCLSFEINKQSGKCYFSKENTATSKKIKTTKSRDYYQRIKSDDELLIFKRTSIPGQDTFGRLKNIELKECHRVCHQNPGCKSYEYNDRTKSCDQSNATHLTQNLQPNKEGWDTYIINPASPTAEVNCGPPKDIDDATKSYKTTTYKSEVTYTCPLGEKLVSICENSSKWSSVETPCEDIQNHFATVKEAILDVKGKILWNKKNVTKEACLEKCWSDKNCLSFEINKENGDCYLSKKTAATSMKLKAAEDRDYYQRVKFHEDFIVFKKARIPKRDQFQRLEDVTVKECKKSCKKHADCTSFQYKKNSKVCSLSNVTHLTLQIKPDNKDSDIYITSAEPTSCKEMKKCGKNVTDGEYWIYPSVLNHKRLKVYCYNMKTDTPKEYITLPHENFASLSTLKPLKICAKLFNNRIDRPGKIVFRKVRIFPQDMSVDRHDLTFSNRGNGKIKSRQGFGDAGDCLYKKKAYCFSKGSMIVNLQNTGLVVGDMVKWETYGVQTRINSLMYSVNRQVVTASCEGKCGGCKPNKFIVQLSSDEPSSNGVKSCASLRRIQCSQSEDEC